jgi:hypothetical protein
MSDVRYKRWKNGLWLSAFKFYRQMLFTREEIIELLIEYEQDSKKEVQGVGQKIRELELN